MTNSKMTRKALFTSIMALMLCFAMLTGTTFAWFTDQETSANNKIIAGNLDVEMYNALIADESAIIGEGTELFDGVEFWEPGVVSYENITIANKGNLALKYQLSVNFVDNGLAEALKVGVIDGGVNTTDREAVKRAVTTWMPIANFVESGELAVNDNDSATAEVSAETYGIVIYWEPSDNDNKFNGNDKNATKNFSVDFGVTLVATQLMAEEDAFGKDYDEDAVYANTYASTASELAAAIEEGGIIALMNDIDLADLATTTYDLRSTPADVTLTVAAGNEVTIDLNGFTLSATSNGTGKNYNMFDVRGVLTLKNGTVVTNHAGANMEWNNSTNVANVTAGGVLNVENADLRNLGGSDMAFVVHLNNWGEVTLNVNNSSLYSTYCAVRAFNSGNDMNNINITNSTLAGTSMSFWVHNYTVEDFGTAEKATAAAQLINSNLQIADPTSGELVVNEAANNELIGKIRYGFTNGIVYNDGGKSFAVVGDVTGAGATLSDALTNGDHVIMNDDLTFSANETANNGYGASGVTVNNGATFDGNGNTLSVSDANGNYGCAVYAQAGTIKNVTINDTFRGIFMGGATGDVYIDNVILDKVCYTFNSDAGNKNYGVYVSNSTLNGWTSYSNAHKEVVFTNCNFGQGTGAYDYAFCRPYNASVFENCVFEEGYEFDTSETSELTFINCYYGDTLITAENASTLCKGDVVFFYNGLNGATIK